MSDRSLALHSASIADTHTIAAAIAGLSTLHEQLSALDINFD